MVCWGVRRGRENKRWSWIEATLADDIIFRAGKPLPFYCPDTILIQNGRPTHWYFTDSGGRIREHKKPTVTDVGLMLERLCDEGG